MKLFMKCFCFIMLNCSNMQKQTNDKPDEQNVLTMIGMRMRNTLEYVFSWIKVLSPSWVHFHIQNHTESNTSS